jgi:hypothetical protein
MMMGAHIANAVIRTEAFAPLARTALIVALFGSFLVLPVRQFIGQRHAGRDLYRLSQSVAALHPVRGNLAACARWNDSLLLAYYLGGRFSGTTDLDEVERSWSHSLVPGLAGGPAVPPFPGGELDAELARRRIDYYLVWSSCPEPSPEIAERPEVTLGRLAELRIYRLGGELR